MINFITYIIVLSCLIKLILATFFIYDKFSIKIIYPINRKKSLYKYKIVEEDYERTYIYKSRIYENYKISKYNYIKTEQNIINYILLIIFPLPIKFFLFRFVLENEFIISIKDINKFTYNDLVDTYENHQSDYIHKLKVKNDAIENKKKIINDLNNK